MSIQPTSLVLEEEVKQSIKAWGDAWSPRDKAPLFNRSALTPFYIQSEELLAFDSTEAEQRTVIKGAKAHVDIWEPFVRSYKFWTFTPVMDSLKVYVYSSNAAAATLFVDNYGVRPNEEEFQFRAHVTLLLEKHDERWVIVHENIWGPVRE